MFTPFKPEHISGFGGLIQFDVYYLLIALCLLFHFIYIQYKQYKATGFKIDFWGFIMFLKVIFPLIIMYPFNLSFYNYISIGIGVNFTGVFIESVLVVTFIGYIFIYLGRYVYDSINKKTKVYYLESVYENNLKSENILFVLKVLTFSLTAITVSIQFVNGELFNGRDFFQNNITFRPIFNAAIILYGITFISQYLFYLNTGKKKFLTPLFIMFVMGFTYGSRGSILEPIIMCYLLWMFKHYKTLKIRYLFIFATCFCVSTVILLALRQSKDSLSSDDILLEIFYGNTFSDARDFAYILAHWDFEILYGKTYFASFISFLPKFASEIRQEWAFSHITNKLIGFDNDHPGMRLGVFGEVFMNFWYLGVVFVSFVFGYLLRHMDKNIKNAFIYYNDPQKAYSKTFFLTFISGITITSSFPSFYMLLILCIFCLFLRQYVFHERASKLISSAKK